MSTFRNPVGPQSPKVYWRRRLLLAIGVVVVIVIIILIVSRPGKTAQGTVGNITNKAPNSAAPSASASGVAANAASACLPANITLTAVTDKASYGATGKPQLSMTIVNTGSKDCTINVGSTQSELIVTSGSEKIWDSKDCQTAPVDTPVTLTPNSPVSSTNPTVWDRTRSSTTTCSAARTPVTAAHASYHLSVKIGSITSKTTAQFALN